MEWLLKGVQPNISTASILASSQLQFSLHQPLPHRQCPQPLPLRTVAFSLWAWPLCPSWPHLLAAFPHALLTHLRCAPPAVHTAFFLGSPRASCLGSASGLTSPTSVAPSLLQPSSPGVLSLYLMMLCLQNFPVLKSLLWHFTDKFFLPNKGVYSLKRVMSSNSGNFRNNSFPPTTLTLCSTPLTIFHFFDPHCHPGRAGSQSMLLTN